MFTENEKKANELKAKIKNTFSNADKALEYKKARQTEYKDLVNSMTNARARASRDTSRALDIMKNNVDEENYVKIKQNQKRAKYDAGPAEALQSLSRMKKNFKQSKATTPSLILPVKKDRSSINAMREAELMRVNDELLGKVMPASKPLLIKSSSAMGSAPAMPASKPLLIKSSSAMGSAPAMMMKPVNTLKKMKKLRDKVASFEFKYIDMSDPMKLGEYKKKQYYNPSGENKNIWLEHVKKCRQDHPEFTYKQALQKCKETYTKKGK